jgi:septum formation protein
VDEEALVAEATPNGPLEPPGIVQLLARAKAEDACRPGVTGLVIGGDSVFAVDGEVFGKPHTPKTPRELAHRKRGKTGVLYSGHWVADVKDGVITAGVGECTEASVTFSADITDEEIDRYVATGEPLKVAGAFTIDARGAAFIDRSTVTPTPWWECPYRSCEAHSTLGIFLHRLLGLGHCGNHSDLPRFLCRISPHT